MPLMFWPKIAGVEDAPNYRPTAGDDRCENCAYYRALNDGSGYCERFSFECEAQSVCDDYVRAGQSKISSAGISARLKEFIDNPITRRVGISAGAGAAAGGGVGAYGSGEDKYREAARGAAAGALTGAFIGGIGPSVRNANAREVFNKELVNKKDTLNKVVAEGGDARERLNFLRDKFRIASNKKAPVAERLQAFGELQDAIKQHGTKAVLEAKITEAKKAKEGIEALKKEKYVPDLTQLATPSSRLEEYGVPTLSALVSGGIGFGLSHDSKEQERYRKSRQK